MSSTSFVITAEEMSSLLTSISCSNAAFIILVYDWLLCLDQEIALIWSGKTRRTVAPLVYILARYMPILYNAFQFATIFPMSLVSCDAVLWVQVISEALSLSAPAVFSAMRTYALSGRTIYLAIIAFVLSIVQLITYLVNYFKFQSNQILPSPFNCSGVNQIPQQLQYKFTMITRACLILADLLVIVITWMYTYESYKIQKSVRLGSSLGRILLYNGTLYFMVLVSLNVLDMVLTALQIDEAVLDSASYVIFFLDPISYILICHFILNLRQVDRKSTDTSIPSNQDGDISIQFASQHMSTLPEFIGPFGELVRTSLAVDPDLDLEEIPLELMQNESGSEADREIAEVSRA